MATNSTARDFLYEVKSLPSDVNRMLDFCSKNKCSDLFIKVGEPSRIYRYGVMYTTSSELTQIDWMNFVQSPSAISSEMNAIYVRNKMLDFSYIHPNGKWRYRVNASYSGGKNIATFRMISDKLPTFDSLGMNKDVVELLERSFGQHQGISMLVGATGSGKTSTLAACINSFSSGYRGVKELPLKDSHMITLEDPIEYIYPSKESTLITQKELGRDFLSYEAGIKSSLREHPTAILVGETRDVETISSLNHASVTGHAVFTTYHSQSVSTALARMNSMIVDERKDVMFDLIANLNFILCQKLEKGRTGYTLWYQYLFFSDGVKKLLTEAIYKNKNIPRVIDSLMANQKFNEAKVCCDWRSNNRR